MGLIFDSAQPRSEWRVRERRQIDFDFSISRFQGALLHRIGAFVRCLRICHKAA